MGLFGGSVWWVLLVDTFYRYFWWAFLVGSFIVFFL